LRRLGETPGIEVVNSLYYGIVPNPKMVFPKIHWTSNFDEPLQKTIRAVQMSTVDHTFTRVKIMDQDELLTRVTGLEYKRDNPIFSSLRYALYKSNIIYRMVVVFVRQPLKNEV